MLCRCKTPVTEEQSVPLPRRAYTASLYNDNNKNNVYSWLAFAYILLSHTRTVRTDKTKEQDTKDDIDVPNYLP